MLTELVSPCPRGGPFGGSPLCCTAHSFQALETMLPKLCPVGPGRAGIKVEADWYIGKKSGLGTPLSAIRKARGHFWGSEAYLTRQPHRTGGCSNVPLGTCLACMRGSCGHCVLLVLVPSELSAPCDVVGCRGKACLSQRAVVTLG